MADPELFVMADIKRGKGALQSCFSHSLFNHQQILSNESNPPSPSFDPLMSTHFRLFGRKNTNQHLFSLPQIVMGITLKLWIFRTVYKSSIKQKCINLIFFVLALKCCLVLRNVEISICTTFECILKHYSIIAHLLQCYIFFDTQCIHFAKHYAILFSIVKKISGIKYLKFTIFRNFIKTNIVKSSTIESSIHS